MRSATDGAPVSMSHTRGARSLPIAVSHIRRASFTAILLLAGFYHAEARSCVSDEVRRTSTGAEVVIDNDCDQPITWAMCIHVSERQFTDFPRGVTAPGGISRYSVWMTQGSGLDYEYNYRFGRNVPVAAPNTCEPATDSGVLQQQPRPATSYENEGRKQLPQGAERRNEIDSSQARPTTSDSSSSRVQRVDLDAIYERCIQRPDVVACVDQELDRAREAGMIVE